MSLGTIREWIKDDRGATLMMVAGMLTALLAVSAFAVDLGWLYLNASRLQRAADAAALAGVVNLPAAGAQADLDAQTASAANKFPIGNPVTNTYASQVLPDNKFQVTLGTQVESFFLKVIGFANFNISRTSTAQYLLPVPMGSPANCFGIGDASALGASRFPGGGPIAAIDLCDDYPQNFWAAVNGRQTAREHGDPYMPECFESSGGSCTGGGPNLDHNTANHYFYGIEVKPTDSFLDVWLYDAGFYDRSGWAETGDEQSLSNGTEGGADTTYTLKLPDATPYDPTDNAIYCSLTINSGADPSTYMNRWARLCGSIGSPAEGIWVLKVDTTGNIGGSNHYSILINTSGLSGGDIPRVYGINDMSIFTNETDGNATVWLAEILPVHAGKKLQLRFYDPGESAPPATMTVQYPDGTTAANCIWSSDSGASGALCSIVTADGSGSLFNGKFINMLIDIPPTYTCDPTANGNSGCYWRMNLNLQTSHDRTTWTANVIGNPVRLLPNA